MNKAMMIAVALVVIGAGAWYMTPTTDPANDPDTETTEESAADADAVAVVNGEVISREAFDDLEANIAAQQGVDTESLDEATKTAFTTQVLDTLISQTLLAQASEASDVVVDDAQIDAQMQQIQGQFPDEAAYADALAAEGLTEAELRGELAQQLRTEAYLEAELDLEAITVSEEEITATYDSATAGGAEAPPLADVRDQVEGMALQQKQQNVVADHLTMLREEAEIEVLL